MTTIEDDGRRGLVKANDYKTTYSKLVVINFRLKIPNRRRLKIAAYGCAKQQEVIREFTKKSCA
jgi:hypothetical protein